MKAHLQYSCLCRQTHRLDQKFHAHAVRDNRKSKMAARYFIVRLPGSMLRGTDLLSRSQMLHCLLVCHRCLESSTQVSRSF